MSDILTNGIIIAFVIIVVLTANGVVDKMNEEDGVCIAGECGFELGCVKEVDIEIKVENGVRTINQNCIKDGWVRDTDYYKELKKEGYRKAEMKFD